ncbi:hypothetical protein CDL12_07997 [Handroanthus impetiginosus]|uniref:RNase H type-1 domain-containing protein n=1 Tax=Handroanthus impetiginosus TaxID=429701 RepID=A0A2G9HP87_9LAMI|nr:hypothetical protein CDL12_07997 [Handroanthus impetiginosus]
MFSVLIRNHNGTTLAAYTGSAYCHDALSVETIAIWEATKILDSWNWDSIIFESDSITAIDLVLSYSPASFRSCKS